MINYCVRTLCIFMYDPPSFVLCFLFFAHVSSFVCFSWFSRCAPIFFSRGFCLCSCFCFPFVFYFFIFSCFIISFVVFFSFSFLFYFPLLNPSMIKLSFFLFSLTMIDSHVTINHMYLHSYAYDIYCTTYMNYVHISTYIASI